MNTKVLALITLLFAGFSVPGHAYTIGGGAIDVGLEDTLIATAKLTGSGTEAERLWVEGIIGGTVTYSGKEENLSYSLVDQLGTTIGAFELQSSADYFIVKDGKVKQSDPEGKTQHALFQNNASLEWGVVDFYAIFGEKWNGDLVISHVSEFNGTTVSEPGTIAILAMALTGLVIARRRKV